MKQFENTRMNRWVIALGAGFAMLAVMAGAFGAHGLRQILDGYHLGIFETAVRYQMYHALALLCVGMIGGVTEYSRRWLTLAASAFVLGIALFCGSLYLLALSGIGWLGAVTPLGGVAFILGWLALIGAMLKREPQTDR